MATEPPKYPAQVEEEPRHSALAEFSRDERRPAVLLLSALLLSALFFGIGLMVGRWTAVPNSTPNAVSSSTVPPVLTPAPTSQSTTSPATNATGETSSNTAQRFSLLVATYDTFEKAQTLIKTLQEAGYRDVRSTTYRGDDGRPRHSVLVGRFTPDEARQAILRMRSAKNPQLKNVKMVEGSNQ